MLSRRVSFGAALGALVVSLQSTAAQAQYYDGGCGSCGTVSHVAAAPLANCTPIQPVQATCYQTVPVTTYAQVKQTVEVPTYETAYEDREVTVLRPVTQSREIEVPTVSYQNVVEMKTVTRDAGRWVTNYHPVAKCAPCQVDPRPGVLGWMNRTGYSMQSAMTPNYRTSRQYVPNMMTCSVPVTKQVAVRGTQRVTVQETKMVAEKKSERVPVQRMVMKKQEVTVMRPQTAYHTVPIGTSMAYGSPFVGGTQMAYGYPIIDNTASTRSALAPKPDPISSERSAFKSDEETGDGFKRDENNIRGSALENRKPLNSDEEEPEFPSSTRRSKDRSNSPIVPAVYRKEASMETAASKPVSTQTSGWRATRKSSERNISKSSLDKPTVSMADSVREK